jgi:3-deoxy-D-manno-octulosonate 8-phosphate phosphatase (KDO 8-P phosphatase)
MELEARCRAVELILSDVDGVLTDGLVIYDNQGIEIKAFHIRDGQGIKLWQRTGRRFGLITSRNSHIVQVRAAELGISIVRQGIDRKLAAIREVAAELGLELHQVCYLGDDLPDLAAIRAVGLGVAVADAAGEVRQAAAHVTSQTGGRGAVREVVELILKAQQRWNELIQRFEN